MVSWVDSHDFPELKKKKKKKKTDAQRNQLMTLRHLLQKGHGLPTE